MSKVTALYTCVSRTRGRRVGDLEHVVVAVQLERTSASQHVS